MRELADKYEEAAGTIRSRARRSGKGESLTSGSTDSPYLALLYTCARTANAADRADSATREIIYLVTKATGWPAGRACLRLSASADSDRWLVVVAGAPVLPADLAVEGLSGVGPSETGRLALAEGGIRMQPGTAGNPGRIALPIRQGEGEPMGVIEFYCDRAVSLEPALEEALIEISDQLARVTVRGWAQRADLRQQAELALTARLASMRELARNLAHEVNQPLAAVVGYAGGALQLLEQGRADEDKMRRALEQVGVQAKRASGIIQEFREFLRREDARQDRVDLRQLVDSAVALAADAARETGVTVRLDMPPSLPAVVGDPVQLQQVLINLIQNAIESMSAPEVRTRRLDLEASVSDQLELRIRDSGTGMAPELVPQLFTPFLTTKPHGLGMGLPISRSIVEFHGGRLSGENNPDGGMTFRIRLPLAKP